MSKSKARFCAIQERKCTLIKYKHVGSSLFYENVEGEGTRGYLLDKKRHSGHPYLLQTT